MKIRVVDTDREFDALEEPWNRLSEKACPNFFSSFDYVRTVWKHFHGPYDRLYILVLSEGPSIVGIAPFYIAPRRTKRIPHRTIQWIAVWEGDRPHLLVEGNEEVAWNEILLFLQNQRGSWEVLDLAEQAIEGPDGRGWSFLSRPGWFCERVPDAVDYYISIEGSWDNYLRGLDRVTLQNWRRRTRKLSSTTGGYSVGRIVEPGRIREALVRYVTLEQSGWKAQAKIGVGKDERHRAFYEDLLVRLAEKGQAIFHFLTTKGEDIAGTISFVQRDVFYARHIAYSPAYAIYSPGILLNAEIIRENFSMPNKEVDFLGMRENESSQRHKSDWTTGRRETVRLTAYRLCSRLLPLIIAKRLERILKGGSGNLDKSEKRLRQ
jgi:CelD/BcsL family acetyltransferase involved in cellulose biosynthesis